MLDVLIKMFYGGVFIGALIGMALTIVIVLIILEIEDKKEV